MNHDSRIHAFGVGMGDFSGPIIALGFLGLAISFLVGIAVGRTWKINWRSMALILNLICLPIPLMGYLSVLAIPLAACLVGTAVAYRSTRYNWLIGTACSSLFVVPYAAYAALQFRNVRGLPWAFFGIVILCGFLGASGSWLLYEVLEVTDVDRVPLERDGWD